MTPLTGLGMWIWQLSHCERGSVFDIARRLVSCGVKWVAVKAGESHDNGQLTPEVIAILRGYGIECAAWWYSRPTTTASEIVLVKNLVEAKGIRHLIMDAEIEWETTRDPVSKKIVPHDWREHAGKFAEQLVDAINDDVFLADAPWAHPKAHPLFPLDEFGQIMGARMPQFYWFLANDRVQHFCDKCDDEWAAIETTVPVCPIGSTLNADGSKHASLKDMGFFLDRYQSAHASSLWSYQHMDPLEWQALKERAIVRPTIPDKEEV